VTPTQTTVLSVKAGANSPTATFKATLNGTPVAATWKVDQGTSGRSARVRRARRCSPLRASSVTCHAHCGAAGQVVTRQIQVNITATQNGPPRATRGERRVGADADDGVAAVGRRRSRRRRGEGLGVAASMAAVTTLNSLRAMAAASPSPSSTRTTTPSGRAGCSRRSSCGRGRRAMPTPSRWSSRPGAGRTRGSATSALR